MARQRNCSGPLMSGCVDSFREEVFHAVLGRIISIVSQHAARSGNPPGASLPPVPRTTDGLAVLLQHLRDTAMPLIQSIHARARSHGGELKSAEKFVRNARQGRQPLPVFMCGSGIVATPVLPSQARALLLKVGPSLGGTMARMLKSIGHQSGINGSVAAARDNLSFVRIYKPTKWYSEGTMRFKLGTRPSESQ